MSFWTSNKIIEATGGTLHGEAFSFSTLNTDTRSLQAGEFFVALSGDNFDGHDYASKAADRGAIAALVEKPVQGLPYIMVQDTLEALQNMARYRREYSTAKIIAITGSVGKTSAKEMLKICLSEYGETYATSGNYNNHIGLPICLCNMPTSSEFAILEMGMNHADEISFLSDIAKPQVALITNVEAVHLEFFDSVQGIAYAKAEIFDGMQGGAAVLPADSPYYELLVTSSELHNCELISFGEAENSSLRLLSSAVEYEYKSQPRSFALSTRGAHWPKAALGILGCVAALDLPLEKAEAALNAYQEQQGRGEVIKLGDITLMDDAYNASPVSMAAAITTLASLGAGRKLAVLGEMLELGENSDALHAGLAEPLQQHAIDAVITVGEGMKPLIAKLQQSVHLAHFSTAEDAIKSIKTLVRPNDNVLCKGSHGSGVYRLVAALKE